MVVWILFSGSAFDPTIALADLFGHRYLLVIGEAPPACSADAIQ